MSFPSISPPSAANTDATALFDETDVSSLPDASRVTVVSTEEQRVSLKEFIDNIDVGVHVC